MDSNKFAINVTQITKEMIFPTIIVKIKFEGECKILCSKKAEISMPILTKLPIRIASKKYKKFYLILCILLNLFEDMYQIFMPEKKVVKIIDTKFTIKLFI